jgi:hypothetical protein
MHVLRELVGERDGIRSHRTDPLLPPRYDLFQSACCVAWGVRNVLVSTFSQSID